ncbi:MAG: S8 family serine peptidase, partial [Bacteroidales bacterium]|nr:S8 family serine peptidase [Bacteroidales bacterium]MBN2749000.1 S8 family serine peptidase [Bacteroidales bacterium]
MKKIYLLWVSLLISMLSFSQKGGMLGSGGYVPKENVQEFLAGTRTLPDSISFKGNYYVIVTLRSIPTQEEKDALKQKGIVLHNYLGNNSYYATIKQEPKKGAIAEQLKSTPITSVTEGNAEWKISEAVSSGVVPEHAIVASGIVSVNVLYFELSDLLGIRDYLKSKGYRVSHIAEEFQTITLEIPKNRIKELAQQPWVKWIEYIAPPAELDNLRGRSMNRSNILSQNTLGGRNLTGKGMNVGIWDGSVEAHPDLGNRLKTQEFEVISEHGQHVSGTMLGAGLIDPKAKGMAPEATLYAWNFNTQQNGLSAPQEMLISARDHGIVVTQNSYGVSMNNIYCTTPSTYNATDLQLDQLVNMHPKLTHVFSAGNDQEKCLAVNNSRYGTSTKRAKNAIFIGALDEKTNIAWFSSWGPMNDGRLLPHITTFGDEVYSTLYGNSYGMMSGTSMACPNASGTLTLIYQRFREVTGDFPIASLAKAAVLNTAEDKGNPGPDYQFGYGQLDGLRAVELIEKGRYFVGNLEHNQEQTYTINVPANAKELRVMLVWSDYRGTNGSKALINDLDLSVVRGGTTYLPWTLNPSNPAEEAKRGIDRINNQEQVTVSNPTSGTYTIKVNGFEVPQGPQEYSIVYEYYTPTLNVTYPNGGESFSPVEKPVVRWSSLGYSGTYTLQLSTDNGATFQTIASNIPNKQKDYVITIPNTLTSSALIRVIQDGTMDVSDAPFNIMPAVNKLSLIPTDCGADGWQLTWDAVDGAAKYKVLKANVNEGKYYEIGETASNLFPLPSLTSERNIYSVKAVAANNAVSERAFAVIANPSFPLDFATAGIPFEENLVEFPSKYIKVTAASGTETAYKTTLFQYSNAHNILMKGSETTTEWNATGDLFANNPDDYVSAKICDIDATSITGELWLRVAAAMGNSGTNNASFRVQADGATVTNTFGQNEISATGSGQNIMYWNLSDKAGKKFSLDFQAVLRNAKDSIQFGHFYIWQPKNDVGITKVTLPAAATTLGTSESITVDVRNYSGYSISNIPVSYSINGSAPVQEVIAGPIEPFKTLSYTFVNKANLSEVDVLFNVEATVTYDSDETPSNNSRTAQTTRFGDYYVMPTTTSDNSLTATATTKLFTDNGGKVLNYTNSVSGVVVISPATTGKKVKIKFLEFDVEDTYDRIIIRDGNLSTSPIIETLTGNEYALPFEVVSTASSGQLYIDFKSDSETNKPGWLAEVSEVDPTTGSSSNTFAITSLPHYNGNYSIPTTIRIKVKNQGATDATDVNVRYRVDNEEWVNEVIPSIAAGVEMDYYFTQKLTIPEADRNFLLTAEITAADSYMDDNTMSKTVSSDKYCFAFTNYSTSSPFYITSVKKGDVENASGASASVYPNYFRNTVFNLYKDVNDKAIAVTVNTHQTNGKIAIFVDWNNDGIYSGAEEGPFTANTSAGITSYSIPLTTPSGIAEGQYYMRVRIAATSSAITPCESIYNNGETEDYMVEVFENFPIAKDVAPIASTLANGSNLSATETVAVTIQNNASVAISNFDIALRVDGGTEVIETVTAEIAPFSSIEYTFTATADLSVAGPHVVEIYTLADGDEDASNNTLTLNILNEKPAVDGFFALNFDGADDVVNAGTLDGTNLQSYTYEAWINPASYGGYGGPIGFGRLFEGKGATIFLHGETNTNYPEHSLVITTGGGTYHTQALSFNLNEWQHVAVSFDNNSKELKVYLNGTEIPVVTKTAATTIDNNAANSLYIGNNASLARPFKGMMDVVRVWSVAKSQAEVASKMHVSAAGEANLIAEFLFDEGYYNSKTYSGAIEAYILNASFDNSAQSIWQEVNVGFASYSLSEQVVDWEEVAPNHFRTDVENTADLNNLIATFTPSMKGATVTVGGIEQISGVTAVDFSNSTAIPVEYTISATHFGRSLESTYKFEAKNEPSTACELLSFAIPSLAISESSVTMAMAFDVAGTTDVTSLATSFTVSDGATAYINGTEIASGAVIDFTNPVTIAITAANGRATSYYSVSLRKQQTITWTPASLAKTYGDPVFTLEAAVSSGAEVYYTSSNPEVISVALNKATVMGTGSATITAHQVGGNNLVAATPVEQEFTVSKKALTITADNKSVDFSDAIPELTMSFSGLVNNETQLVIDQLPSISTAAVQNSPAGTYPIVLTGGADNNYELTLVNGELTIVDVAAFDVTFSVTYKGASDADATIAINGLTLTTSATGEATIKLKAGSYPYTVTKAGREEVSGNVDVVDANQNVNIELVDPLPVYTITYTTDGNGTINGTATQSVKKGLDGAEVTALPSLGYLFLKWSDDVTTAARKETNVQGDLSFTALFTLKSYTLTYSAGSNGTLSGEAAQTVAHGTDGTAVEAIPDAGYSFVQWSDGVKENPRTDVNVMMDKSVTAEYTKIYTLPYTQTYNGTTLPEDWQSVDNNGSGGVWQFKAAAKDNKTLTGSTANYAILDSDLYGSGKTQDADLISPTFNLTSYSTVNLKFNHYYRHYSSSATVSYSINGGAWVEIQKWTANTANPVAFDQLIDAVAGQNNVRFKWNFKGSWGYYWLVDDIEITGNSAAGEYTVTYTAGENGTLQGATTGVISQVVTAGENGPTVTAVPNPGYVFSQWSDGVTDNPRTDLVIKDIDVTAIFGSDCTPISALPYKETFDADASAPDCWSAPVNANGLKWAFGPASYPVSTGNSINFDPTSIAYGATETAEVTSPVFNLTGYSEVYLSFRHLHYPFTSSTAKVMYSTDNGSNWIELQTWTDMAYNEHFCMKLPATSATIKFKWEITCGSMNLGWFIDDVELRTEATVLLNYEAQEIKNADGDWIALGTIDGDKEQLIVVGENATPVTAVPITGYKFTEWSDGITTATRTDENVLESELITAFFEPITYILSYTAGEGGSIVGEPTQIVVIGADGTEVEAVPATGYHFVKWSDGVTANPRTDANVTAHITVVAEFAQDAVATYTLTYTAGANGSITGEATQTVEQGANGTAVEAVPATGYHFVKWSDGLTANPRTDANVTADITVEAEFAQDAVATYTLTYTAGANGS